MALGLITGLGKFFFLLWELGYSYWRSKPVYTFERTMGTVGCELLRVLMSLLIVPLFVSAYLYLFSCHSLFSLSTSDVSTWFFAVMIFSFLDYWSHRLSHSVPFLWAIHSVHHQVEELNAIAGGRVSFINDSVMLSALLSMAVLGIPISVTLAVVGVFGVYSAILHCPFLGSFGWIGYVVASPAFHRLHHGIQPQYLNKNFSISLSFWDRLFGTYVEEDVPPKYGLVNGFATNSPFRANWQPFVEYFTKSTRNHASLSPQKWTFSQQAYLLCQLGVVLYCASLLQSKTGPELSTEVAVLVVGAVLGSLATFDGLLRRTRVSYYVEGARVGLIMPGLFFVTGIGKWSGDSFFWVWGSAFFFLAWFFVAFRGGKKKQASKSRRSPRAAA